MAIEYSGYVAPKQIDWTTLSSGLSKSITDAGEARVARREELDKIAADNIDKINKLEQGKSQTFQTMILDFQDGGRNKQNDWNSQLKAGTMTEAEYKKRTQNLSDYTNILATSAKTLDEKINNAVQREADGQATDWEMEMLKETGSMAEIRDSKFVVSDDGSIMWTKVDPKTGAIIGDPKDVRTPNLPQNMVDNKVIVTDFVKDATKDWETVQIFKDLGGGAYQDFTSVKNHKDANGKSIYNEMAAKVAVAATSSPRATLSVLADNGVINPIYYWNEDEKKAAIAQRYAEIAEVNRVANNPLEPTEEQKKLIELSLVKKGIDADGTYNPQLTDDQVKLAQDHVMKVVDMQMKETMDARGRTVFAPSGGGGGGRGGATTDPNDFSLYKQITESWGKPGGAAALTAASGGKFVFEPNMKYNPKTKKDEAAKGYIVKAAGADWMDKGILIENQKDIAPYFFGTGTPSEGTTGTYPEYERQADLYWKARQGGGTSKPTTTINTSEYN